MSNIRVTYTGLIALVTSLVGVFTGTVFVIIVTRRLTPDDFGLWTLIGTVISYVLVVEPIISYWTTRQISRGEKTFETELGKKCKEKWGLDSTYQCHSIIPLGYISKNGKPDPRKENRIIFD